MSTFEKRLVDAILTRIRARRENPSMAKGFANTGTAVPMAPAKIREARFSDFEAVRDLKGRWGLIPDSLENWERLWRNNPAFKYCQTTLPIGWVLEAGGQIVGYLGNIATHYRYGDRTLLAVTGHGFVVEPTYRMVSLSLMAAFFRQKSVDIYLTTTAIAPVGKIARVFKSDPLPQPDYEVLFWVLRPRPFAEHVMEKLELPPMLSAAGGFIASLTVGADRILRSRRPRRFSTSLVVRELPVSEIGDDFQSLWIRKLAEGTRLLADRSPETLRWHFETPGDLAAISVLACYRDAALVGYAVIRNGPTQLADLRRSLLADMLIETDDPEIANTLLAAGYDHAKRAGSHIFEVLGFPQNIRRLCSQWHPYSRKYPACPFYYRAADPVLHRDLAAPSAWYASPFDGDTTLMPLFGVPTQSHS